MKLQALKTQYPSNHLSIMAFHDPTLMETLQMFAVDV